MFFDDNNNDESFTSCPAPDQSFVDVETEQHFQEREVATMEEKVAAYNRRVHLEAFRIKPQTPQVENYDSS